MRTHERVDLARTKAWERMKAAESLWRRERDAGNEMAADFAFAAYKKSIDEDRVGAGHRSRRTFSHPLGFWWPHQRTDCALAGTVAAGIEVGVIAPDRGRAWRRGGWRWQHCARRPRRPRQGAEGRKADGMTALVPLGARSSCPATEPRQEARRAR
jgi:hypothetical protein